MSYSIDRKKATDDPEPLVSDGVQAAKRQKPIGKCPFFRLRHPRNRGACGGRFPEAGIDSILRDRSSATHQSQTSATAAGRPQQTASRANVAPKRSPRLQRAGCKHAANKTPFRYRFPWRAGHDKSVTNTPHTVGEASKTTPEQQTASHEATRGDGAYDEND
jgi:hypothetical protein